MITPAEADALILAQLKAFPSEDCPLAEAHGRVLRGPVRADRDLPPFDRVTMDGFALRAASLASGTRTFRIWGTQAAGMIAQTLGDANDACIEVMTGAVLPVGADAVVPYEDAVRKGETMTIGKAAATFPSGHAVHRRGSDREKGAEILPAGVRLTGREIAAAAACGCTSLTVALRPRIAVVATGDELVDIDMPVAAHQIRRSNDYALRAALVAAGYTRVECFHLRDVKQEIEHRLWHILAEFDVVLLCGGVSKGKFDYIPTVLADLGVKMVFHGVAQRPGKPLWYGVTAGRNPVFALPGNPVSSFTCLHRYVLPALARASGQTVSPAISASLAFPQVFRADLTWFLPVRLADGEGGVRLAVPDAVNTSGDFAGLLQTDGFVELSGGLSEYPRGFLAPFRPWL